MAQNHVQQQSFLLLVFVSALLSQKNNNNSLEIIYEWKFANLNYTNPQDQIRFQELGLLIPGNVAILDADFYEDPNTSKRRIFVTTPQFLPGIPATFYEVKDQKHRDPLMTPYPSWEAQNINSCDGPVSVYRIFIDKCGWMWVLDCGMTDTFIVPKHSCRPKILIYDLSRKDKLIARYYFPNDVMKEDSVLVTIVTESYQNDCGNSFAYIADVQARGLIVFDLANKKSWRVENSYFYPSPKHGVIKINQTTFDLMDGLFGLALSPESDRDQRKLYFHSAASLSESWVLTSVLKDVGMVKDAEALKRQFHHSQNVHAGQSTVEVMTDDGILIYPVLSKTALACWNSALPATADNQHVLLQDEENFQFISGLKLRNKTLMITSSKLQNYILFNANGTDIKYRVMIIENVDRLLEGSPCNKHRMTDRGPTFGAHTETRKSSTSRPFRTSRQPPNELASGELSYEGPQAQSTRPPGLWPPFPHERPFDESTTRQSPFPNSDLFLQPTLGGYPPHNHLHQHTTSHSPRPYSEETMDLLQPIPQPEPEV